MPRPPHYSCRRAQLTLAATPPRRWAAESARAARRRAAIADPNLRCPCARRRLPDAKSARCGSRWGRKGSEGSERNTAASTRAQWASRLLQAMPNSMRDDCRALDERRGFGESVHELRCCAAAPLTCTCSSLALLRVHRTLPLDWRAVHPPTSRPSCGPEVQEAASHSQAVLTPPRCQATSVGPGAPSTPSGRDLTRCRQVVRALAAARNKLATEAALPL